MLIGGAIALPAAAAVPDCVGTPTETAEALSRSMDTSLRSPGEVQAFYVQAESACVWPDLEAEALRAVVAGVGDDGLEPELFHAKAIAERSPPADGRAAAERDMLLTDAALTYARVMMSGAVDPRSVYASVDVPRPAMDVVGDLQAALAQGRVAAWLAGLPPALRQYAGLKEALRRYRAIAAAGGWRPLPDGGALEPGAAGPAVAALAERLRAEGELDQVPDRPVLKDAVLEALKRFQAHHGLKPDGKVGRMTLAALNIPVDQRIEQIVASLERVRELGRVTPPTRIEVNAAAATIRLIRDDRPVMSMRAVVGEPDPMHRTPILLSEIDRIVINPPWIVPPSIIGREIQPKLRQDPDYLWRNRMRWSGNRLIQEPGPWNSLGRIKFEFANPFGVYLHDTPARSLFARDDRAKSHGCIRAERALDLAVAVLGPDSRWDQAAIERAIGRGETVRLAVQEPMPVLVTYQTAAVDDDGKIQFYNDSYGWDRLLLAAMARQLVPRPGVFPSPNVVAHRV